MYGILICCKLLSLKHFRIRSSFLNFLDLLQLLPNSSLMFHKPAPIICLGGEILEILLIYLLLLCTVWKTNKEIFFLPRIFFPFQSISSYSSEIPTNSPIKFHSELHKSIISHPLGMGSKLETAQAVIPI